MKYFETKHEKDSTRITTLFAIILILLIFIVGPKYIDPPIEYGVAVNFGTTDYGSGNIQPKKPIKSEIKEIIKKPEVTESQSEISKPQEAKEDVVTQNNEESIAIKKQKKPKQKQRQKLKLKQIVLQKKKEN